VLQSTTARSSATVPRKHSEGDSVERRKWKEYLHHAPFTVRIWTMPKRENSGVDEKNTGRRDDCHDGLLFPPERDET